MKRKNTYFRNGTFYYITNHSNGLALSMPFTQNYSKDLIRLEKLNTQNINQIWMIEEVQPNRFQFVHAKSTLVLTNYPNKNQCKLQFGRQKANQLYHISFVKQQQFKGPNTKLQLYNSFQKSQTERMIKETSSFKKRSTTKVIEPPLSKKHIMFQIRQNSKSQKYLFCKKQPDSKIDSVVDNVAINFMEVDLESYKDQSIWEFEIVQQDQNQYLRSACVIASLKSGLALDVPEASEKKGLQIIQYSINFRFNQRWIFFKIDPSGILIDVPGYYQSKRLISEDEAKRYNFYTIMNAKTGLMLDIKNQSSKQGTPIIQWSQTQGKNQIWRLEQQAQRAYIIRSVLNKELVLGVKQNSIKQAAEIVTVSKKYESQNIWAIYGSIPS